MNEQRTYFTRSTRDGLGIVPDGTHPVLESGEPDFDSFTTTAHALDFIRNTPEPFFADLAAAVANLSTNHKVFAMRSIATMAKNHGDTSEALPYWKALYILTKDVAAEASRDPFNNADIKAFKRALAADGVPALVIAGLIDLEEARNFLAASVQVTPSITTAPPADDFAAIIASNFPEGY